MFDTFAPVIVAIVLVLAAVGLFGVVVQARYEYRKRKAYRDIDRVIQKRGLR